MNERAGKDPADQMEVIGPGLAAAEAVAVESSDTDMPAPGQRRALAARGAVINGAFVIMLGTVNVLRALIVAGLVTASEYGVWSIVFLALGLLISLKAVAVSDKFIQQDETNQEVAFQKAFTLQLIAGIVLAVAMIAIAPLIAAIYDDGDLLLPAASLSLMMIGSSLQAPVWIFYRRMDFLRQRLLISVEPLVGFAVTVALAAAGSGYWGLVAGAIAGAVAGGIAALVACPYRFAIRIDRETARHYFSFSWPLMVAVVSGLGIAQVAILVGESALGLAGAGAIGLGVTITLYTNKIDEVITQTLYPAICRVTDQRELLEEAFVKSNRLALMWGVPFGVSLALFAPDLVEFGIGDQWEPAVFMLQVLGVAGAIGHVGFNWTAFYRALGDTRPIALVTVVAFIAFCAVTIPLIYSDGLDGFGIGIFAMTVTALCVRWYFIARLFPGIRIAVYVLRAIAPTVPAVAAVLALRLLADERTLGIALGELAAYVAVTIVATIAFERRLLGEALGYLRGRPAPVGSLPTA